MRAESFQRRYMLKRRPANHAVSCAYLRVDRTALARYAASARRKTQSRECEQMVDHSSMHRNGRVTRLPLPDCGRVSRHLLTVGDISRGGSVGCYEKAKGAGD